MIYFCFRLRNPFSKNDDWKYDDLVQKEKRLSKNKTLEYNYGNPWKNVLIGLTLDTRFTGQDHAGPEVEFCLLGWQIGVRVSDNRHWNHEKNRWNTEDEYLS